ncbi:MAG: gfo/Idh/MocA family oxidoreductase [Phycisphaera sp.]|nr:gfo/Idh/MocA family oxidoreductase [Phycisphaera sp.]
MTTTRRTFVKSIAAAGITLPTALPRLVRAASANEKLNIACVGTSNRARADINGLASENFVAFADVDSNFLGKALSDYTGSKGYEDYREMLDKEQKNIDAVMVGTPDHQHAHAALRALNLGKHTYCEKPLAHTAQECRLMIAAAERNKVSTQMGTQIHAGDNYRRVVEKIQAGAIGPVREVHNWIYGAMYSGARFPDKPDPVPANLNWDLWVGPAQPRDYYDKLYHPFNWRGWWDFGGGGVADFGCHYMDLPFWALGLEYPTGVQAWGPEPKPLRCSQSTMIEYRFPARGDMPALKMYWHLGGTHIDRIDVYKKFGLTKETWKGNGILFVGDNGMLISDYSKHKLLPEDKFADFKDPPRTIAESIGHHNEWIKACKEGTPTTCNFSYSGKLAETVQLGIAAHRAGNVECNFDPATGKADNDAVNRFIFKEYRKGWEIDKIA